MKKINYLIVLFIIAFNNCSLGQIRNNLTIIEFNNIKINGIKLELINNSKGDTNQMKTFFGNNISSNTGSEPSLHREFWDDSKGFYFYFEENDPNDPNDYMLYTFRIEKANTNITIKGKTITIGDNISQLGNVQINANGTDIVFGTSSSDDALMIKFNSSSRLITSIEYNLFN